jgi:hypothetical protein
MKLKLAHPLWTHLPAVVIIIAAVIVTIQALPFPDPAPVHFDINGTPDGYGSPWLSSLLMLGLSLGYLAISVWMDELWARQEKRKHFNWLSLFDEVVIAGMCSVQIAYVNMLASKNFVFAFPWTELVLLIVLATGIAVVLEIYRPFRPYHKVLKVEDTALVRAEVEKLVGSGQPITYWESQNPAYVGFLSVIIPVIMIVAAVFSWDKLPWVSVVLALPAVGMFIMYGGFRTLVNRDTVTVKMGIFGIKLLQLKLPEITEVLVHSFEPMRDFGGYGIRFNQEMQAFYLRGDRGVKITCKNGKKYLLGSDSPEHLATVISAVAGL